jgi:hypothetical protein
MSVAERLATVAAWLVRNLVYAVKLVARERLTSRQRASFSLQSKAAHLETTDGTPSADA